MKKFLLFMIFLISVINFPLNINMIRYLDPSFVEAMSLESVKNLKEDKEVESKIIFKIPKDKKYSNEELLKAGVDLAYTL